MTDEEKEDKIWEENSVPLTKEDKEELLKLTVNDNIYNTNYSIKEVDSLIPNIIYGPSEYNDIVKTLIVHLIGWKELVDNFYKDEIISEGITYDKIIFMFRMYIEKYYSVIKKFRFGNKMIEKLFNKILNSNNVYDWNKDFYEDIIRKFKYFISEGYRLKDEALLFNETHPVGLEYSLRNDELTYIIMPSNVYADYVYLINSCNAGGYTVNEIIVRDFPRCRLKYLLDTNGITICGNDDIENNYFIRPISLTIEDYSNYKKEDIEKFIYDNFVFYDDDERWIVDITLNKSFMTYDEWKNNKK